MRAERDTPILETERFAAGERVEAAARGAASCDGTALEGR